MARRAGSQSTRMRAIAVAIALASPPMHAHAAEIAVRFFDDNAAAQGAALSTRAHAEVEKAAGATLRFPLRFGA